MNQRGFTLLEMLVAIFIFSTITVVTVALFITSLNLQRRAFNLQQAEENANFVLESMAKEIRVSTIAPGSDTADCAVGASELMVTHPDYGIITYFLNGTNVVRAAVAAETINSNTVEFTKLAFCVDGSDTGDQLQPRITIRASIQSANTTQQATVDVQTTLSLRTLSN